MGAPRPIVIMGGHGSGQIVTSVIEEVNSVAPTWHVLGFLNDVEDIGCKIGPYPVVGRTAEAHERATTGCFVHYAMRNAKFARPRIERLKEMQIPDDALATIVHPAAHTSGSAYIGAGSLLCAQVNLSFGARVHRHNHLYGNSFIGHDSEVRDYAWVANNAAVGARCTIGEGAHLGTNCSLREDVTIGAFAIVGIGAVVLKDVGEDEIVVGNPARCIGRVDRYDQDPVESRRKG